MKPVDFSVLNEFKELMGDEGEQEVRELVELYLSDGALLLENIQTALASGDADTLHRAAHSFKSSCGNIGATELQATCQILEQRAAVNGCDDDCRALATQAESAFADVKVALSNYLQLNSGDI